MSTMEIVCGRCEKKFRVRAEFAGRSTRCPGCSAPITIAGAPPRPAPPPTRTGDDDQRQPRRRPRDDEDDEPRRPALNWAHVETAFRREQLAVVFAILSIFGGFFVYCAGNVASPGGAMEGFMIFVVFLFGIGPALATASFGLMARIAALGVPRETLARGSAVSSLICGLAGLACLVGLAFAYMSSLDAHQPDRIGVTMMLMGLALAVIAATATFVGFLAQIGIYQRSAGISRACGRFGVAITVCLGSMLAIAFLYTIFDAMTTPYFGDPSRSHNGFAGFVFGVLMPLAIGVHLILYHRMLAAGRNAVKGETTNQSED